MGQYSWVSTRVGKPPTSIEHLANRSAASVVLEGFGERYMSRVTPLEAPHLALSLVIIGTVVALRGE